MPALKSGLSPVMRSPFTLEQKFSQPQTCGYSELLSLCIQGYVIAKKTHQLRTGF